MCAMTKIAARHKAVGWRMPKGNRGVRMTGWAVMGLVCLLAAGCKEQRKKSAAKQQPPQTQPKPPPPDAPPPASANDGFGVPPFVTQADLRPLADLASQSPRSLNQQLNEIGELIYGYNLPFGRYTLDPAARPPSAAEVAAEECMNSWLSGVTFVTDREKPGGFRANDPDRGVFEQCMQSKQIVVGTEIKYNFRHNIAFECTPFGADQGPGQNPVQGPGQSPVQGQVPGGPQGFPDLSGQSVVSPAFSKGYCEQGQRASVRYNVQVEVRQVGADQKELRLYRRTKALTDRSGGGLCTWTWDQARRAKIFSDCVFLDRVDASGTATHRFVLVSFDRVEGQQSASGGFIYTGGTASVQLNDYKGTITFVPQGAPSWAMAKEGGKDQARGPLAIPQGHGLPPGSYPGGGGPGTNPGGGWGYIPVVGPNGAQEQQCDPRVTPENIELSGGMGNGVVSLWRREIGDSVYHAGYVHPDRTNMRQSFIARVRGNVRVWCRTYLVQSGPNLSSEGVFIDYLGGDQMHAAFVTRHNVYVPVGTPVYQSNRPAQESPAVYLVALEPNTGNVRKASWFDVFSQPAGAFSSVVLDAQGLPQGLIRLRAFVTQAQATGCPNQGTGTYGVVLRGDLSGLAAQQAENCPGSTQF
jgi:hypothetical protein